MTIFLDLLGFVANLSELASLNEKLQKLELDEIYTRSFSEVLEQEKAFLQKGNESLVFESEKFKKRLKHDQIDLYDAPLFASELNRVIGNKIQHILLDNEILYGIDVEEGHVQRIIEAAHKRYQQVLFTDTYVIQAIRLGFQQNQTGIEKLFQQQEEFLQQLRLAQDFRTPQILDTEPSNLTNEQWLAYLSSLLTSKRYRRWDADSAEDYYIDLEIPINIKRHDLKMEGIPAKRRLSTPLLKIGLDSGTRKLLLLGDPGTGKTTGIEKLAYEQAAISISLLENNKVGDCFMPVFLELKGYIDANKSLSELFRRALAQLNLKIDLNDVKTILSQTAIHFLIMIDGLNEVALGDQNELASQINDWTRDYSHHRYIVTCRIGDYYRPNSPLPKIDWEGYRIEDIQEEDIIRYLDEKLKMTGKNSDIYYKDLPSKVKSLISNPLLLSMLAEVYRSDKTKQEPIRNRGDLYGRFINHRLNWESRKGEAASKFYQDDKRLVLAVIGFWHLFESESYGQFNREYAVENWLNKKIKQKALKISDTIENWQDALFSELCANVLLRSRSEQEQSYEFYHQSFQEFAAADYLRFLFNGSKALKNVPSLTRDDIDFLANYTMWEESLVLLCGIEINPSAILISIANHNPVLAGRCLFEGNRPQDSKSVKYVFSKLLINFLDSDDTATGWRLYNFIEEGRPYSDLLLSAIEEFGTTLVAQSEIVCNIHKAAARYFKQTGKWAEARARYEDAQLKASENNTNGELNCVLASVLSELADLDDVEGKYESAKVLHLEALSLVQQANCKVKLLELAEIYKRYGINRRYMQQWDDAQIQLETALAYANEAELASKSKEFRTRTKSIKGEVLLGIGKIHLEQEHYAESRAFFDKARLIFEEINDNFLLAQAIHKLGESYFGFATIEENVIRRQSYSNKARTHFEDSLEIKEERADLFGIGISYEKLGRLEEFLKNYEVSIEHQERSLRNKLVLQGDKRGLVLSNCSKARSYSAIGKFDLADAALQEARESLIELQGDWEMFAEYRESRGRVILAQLNAGHFSDLGEMKQWIVAIGQLEQARQIWQRTGKLCRLAETNRAIDTIRLRLIHSSLAFCPKCGNDLQSALPFEAKKFYDLCRKTYVKKQQIHLKCLCGHVIFINPKIGATAILEKDDGVVLVKRRVEPFKGKWVLISGYLETDETPYYAAIREAAEEAGVNVSLETIPFGTYTFRDDPRSDMLILAYRGSIIDGDLVSGDESADVKVFLPDEILASSEIIYEVDRQILTQWIKEKKPQLTDRNLWPFFMNYE